MTTTTSATTTPATTASALRDRQRQIAERRQQIEDAQKAAIAELIAEVRQERLAVYQAAEERLQQALARLSSLRAALQTNIAALRVDDLHRVWWNDVQAFNTREVFRPKITRYRKDSKVLEADFSPEEMKSHRLQEQAFEKRDREWMARLLAEQDEYRSAVGESYSLNRAFETDSVHAEIDQLRRQVRETAEALNKPIGD